MESGGLSISSYPFCQLDPIGVPDFSILLFCCNGLDVVSIIDRPDIPFQQLPLSNLTPQRFAKPSFRDNFPTDGDKFHLQVLGGGDR